MFPYFQKLIILTNAAHFFSVTNKIPLWMLHQVGNQIYKIMNQASFQPKFLKKLFQFVVNITFLLAYTCTKSCTYIITQKYPY